MNPYNSCFLFDIIYLLFLKLLALSSLALLASAIFAFRTGVTSHSLLLLPTHMDALVRSSCQYFLPLILPFFPFSDSFQVNPMSTPLSASWSSRRDSSPCSTPCVVAPNLPIISHANCSLPCAIGCTNSFAPSASSVHLPAAPIASSRHPFLKKPSHVDLEALLNKITLPTIREWCTHLSIEVLPPHRRTKSSFTRPLFDLSWTKFSHYNSLSLDSICNAISPMNRASLPETRDGLTFASSFVINYLS